MYKILDTHANGSVGTIDFLQDERGGVLLGVCIDHDFDVMPDDMKGTRAFLCTADCLAYIFGNIRTDDSEVWLIYQTWTTHDEYYKWLNRNTMTD